MTCSRIKSMITLASLLAGLCIGRAAADEPKPTEGQIQQAEKLVEEAKGINWDSQTYVIESAWDRVFEQHNWNSESDQYTRHLLGELNRIPPWEPQRREEVFMNNIRARYMLTEDQAGLARDGMRRASIQVAMKHWTELAPVAMEFIQTRLNNKEFTSEQVQRWSRTLMPIMPEALASVRKVAKDLESTMDAEQRRILRVDIQALERRHQDVEKSMRKWAKGEWNPTEWGLQDDPIHAAAMAEYRAKQELRNQLVDLKQLESKPDAVAMASNESEWERYVKWFILHYGCDEKQKTQAYSILENSRGAAFAYRKARGEMIVKYEDLVESAEDDAKKAHYAEELQRLRRPIGDIFDRMCKRLDALLTREQRRLKPGAPADAKQPTASAGSETRASR